MEHLMKHGYMEHGSILETDFIAIMKFKTLQNLYMFLKITLLHVFIENVECNIYISFARKH